MAKFMQGLKRGLTLHGEGFAPAGFRDRTTIAMRPSLPAIDGFLHVS
jgi:hypothetical protein